MKFRYGYRTKDNEKVEGVISATSREDVYAQLRREGRKPYMVEPLPGVLNRLSGISKRWLAIGVLAVLAIALAVALGRARTPAAPQASTLDAVLDSPTRRQPIGDAAIIDKGIREGWSDVFTLEGDRFLASFAVPGTPPAIRSTTEEKVREALHSTPTPSTYTSGSASLEARQIRAMVEGMKQELREFIADGGTIKQYGKRLVQRQEAELGYYHRAKAELDRAIAEKRSEREVSDLVEKHNAALRKIGVKLLVLPD